MLISSFCSLAFIFRLFINEMHCKAFFFFSLYEKDFFAEFGELYIGCHVTVVHLTGRNDDPPVW